MRKFSKLAAILAVCAFIFGGLLVSCSPHGTGYGLDDGQSAGSGGSGGAGGGSGGAGGGSGGAGGGSGGGGGAPVAVTGITLNQASATIGIGETLSLTYTITPENATDKTVTWTSSDETVATVENGVIKAIKAGEATITAKAGDKTATCAVTVNALTLDLSTVTADTVIADNTTVTGTLGANVKISIADGATVTLKNASINADGAWTSGNYACLTCAGDATITLEGTNTVKGFNIYYPGIFVPKGKTLTIKGSGSLAANSTGRGAGIGGCYADGSTISKEGGSCGTIVIEGGTITATGGSAAGIGSGYGSDCEGVTITGGTVTATGGYTAAGIGSGGSGSCGPISITGGTVTATGGGRAAGIGCGDGSASCGPISITGGTVTAEGGSYAAGVGTGEGGSTCGAITVANTVTKFTASKGSGATNSVGRGNGGACGAVTIGGTVYWDGSAYQNEGATVLGQSPYTYPLPTGGIDGLFSVSDTKKVYFSKGNLRATYDGSLWTWSFADHQYDAVGNAAANTSINGNGTVSENGAVDLFGWVGANSAFTGMAAFGISNSETEADYGNVDGEALKNDWGANAISNGGNVANYGWRTLTQAEWNYVLETRAGADSKKGAATVSGVKGRILLPDAWTLPAGASFTAGAARGYITNSYTAEQWAVMESAGAVFLPVPGRRNGSTVDYSTAIGYYWSATSSGMQSAYGASFTASSFSATVSGYRYKAAAVRLAKDSN